MGTILHMLVPFLGVNNFNFCKTKTENYHLKHLRPTCKGAWCQNLWRSIPHMRSFSHPASNIFSPKIPRDSPSECGEEALSAGGGARQSSRLGIPRNWEYTHIYKKPRSLGAQPVWGCEEHENMTICCDPIRFCRLDKARAGKCNENEI